MSRCSVDFDWFPSEHQIYTDLNINKNVKLHFFQEGKVRICLSKNILSEGERADR